MKIKNFYKETWKRGIQEINLDTLLELVEGSVLFASTSFASSGQALSHRGITLVKAGKYFQS